MLTKKKLKTKIRNLRYFDSHLQLAEAKVERINPSNQKELERYTSEMLLAGKLMTIHMYLNLPEDYSMEKNPSQIITKAEYKIKLQNPFNADELGLVEGFGNYMDSAEWDLFEETYKELSNA